jgi:hypothetical protein
VPTDNGGGSYTFFTQEGIPLTADTYYWLVLWLDSATMVEVCLNSNVAPAVEPGPLEADLLLYRLNGSWHQRDDRSACISFTGCCDPSARTIRRTRQELACGVHELASTFGLETSITLTYYPSFLSSRFRANRDGCLITSFTVTLLPAST